MLIRDLALAFPARGWSVLLGPSGVGKSTLGRIIAGLPGPHRLDGASKEAGPHRLDGADEDADPHRLDGAGEWAGPDGPQTEDPHTRDPHTGGPQTGRGTTAAAPRVALMAQEGQLLPWADLVGNVVVGARLRGQRPDRARARALLAQVGLGGLERRRPDTLSGGQRQRVALARVLMEDCPVVVLDEPFSALDTATRLAMQDLAAELLRGRCVVLITHDPLEAVRLADRAWLLGPAGAEALALPDAPVPRAVTAPATLAAQGGLLARLRAPLGGPHGAPIGVGDAAAAGAG
ncbi:MAG: ATP-binding cassette domain-containing protein [Alkalilacustris sp.]